MTGLKQVIAVLFCALGGLAATDARAVPDSDHSLSRYRALKGADSAAVVTLYSTTDDPILAPLIDGFQREHPDLGIDVYNLDTLDLFNQVLGDVKSGSRTADLLLSSAMDLQMKLVNDGYAHAYDSAEARRLPDWANWRNEAFAVSYEPAVIVYNKGRIRPDEVPATRRDLAVLLETRPARFHGKIATYDPRRSGVGFLFVTQDAEHSAEIWRLARAMGQTGVKLFTSSAAMLRRVAEGQSDFAYNILGSYARAWTARDDRLAIILPQDHTLVMSRLAVIPKQARNRRGGEVFLDWLLSESGQQIIADDSYLYSIHPDVTGTATSRQLRQAAGERLRPIPVAPGVMVYLDRTKRQRFLKRFEQALGGYHPPPAASRLR